VSERAFPLGHYTKIAYSVNDYLGVVVGEVGEKKSEHTVLSLLLRTLGKAYSDSTPILHTAMRREAVS
jgi:hypothetical protein